MKKPIEILELERDHSFDFKEVFNIDDLFDYSVDNEINKYFVENGKVVGIAIYHCKKSLDLNNIKFPIDLKYLDLAYNKIKKINNVDFLINLNRLELNNNDITKIENLDGLKNLKQLKLDSNKITKIENLELLDNIVKLDLSDNNLTNIENLESLKKLKELDISSNEIVKIENLDTLLNLESLNIGYNEIKKIENLENLSNLYEISLEENKIAKLQNLECLKKLKILHLDGNLISIIENIDNLISLEELYLSENGITEIENIPNIKNLDLGRNKISKIKNLEEAIDLKYLNLSRNKIVNIESLHNNVNLVSLVLSNNKINEIKNLEKLIKLKRLILSQNKIAQIKNLNTLVVLEELILDNNRISQIKTLNISDKINRILLMDNNISDIRILLKKYINILNFDYKTFYRRESNSIYLYGNPLGEDLEARLGIEDLDDRKSSLIDYYENIRLGAEPFREAKLMLLGEGGAGKTNFSNHLMGIDFEIGKSATTGIKIENWKPEIEGNQYRINIWDFGGQWIQQQVHQFFLTSECIYVIILNARHSEQPHKWLDWIKNYGTNSKTIVVINQMEENPTRYLEENNLRLEYPFIHDFHYISLLKAHEKNKREIQNIDYLIEDIKEQLISLKNINVLHPSNYHRLKTDLEDNFLNNNHSLQFEEFEKVLINKHGIKGNSEILLKVLQIMGTLRYFESHGRLILSPEWLSDGIYKIMMSKIANEKLGVLKESDIITIMEGESNSEYIYKKNDINFLRQLMQDFELAYIDESKNYFIPTQFANDIPNSSIIKELKEDPTFEFVFEFDTYFPEILISKLIVFFFGKVSNDIYWKTGILLEDEDRDLNKSIVALIQSLERERRIKISMKGSDIRNFFKEIRNRILGYLKNTNYKYKEYVLYEDLSTLIDYKQLITLYKSGEKEMQIINPVGVHYINVIETLGIVNNEKELEILRKKIEELKQVEHIMGDKITNINIQGNIENIQTGNKNHQIINKNTIKTYNFHELNSNKEEIKAFIEELEELKEKNNIQQNINYIFIDLLEELSKVDLDYLQEKPKEAKTLIQKIYDNGKWLNDWKNITILPYEILDKGSKIIEAIKPVIKPLLSAF